MDAAAGGVPPVGGNNVMQPAVQMRMIRISPAIFQFITYTPFLARISNGTRCPLLSPGIFQIYCEA
jgi:hypothetical protein